MLIPLDHSTLKNPDRLHDFLERVNAKLSAVEAENGKLKEQLKQVGGQAFIDQVLKAAQRDLGSRGRFPLPVEGLHGQLAESQIAQFIQFTTDPTTTIDANQYDTGTMATFNGNIYQVTAGAGGTHTWSQYPIGTNVVTTNTTQIISADKSFAGKVNITSRDLELNGAQIQSFQVSIRNNGGTIQHAVSTDGVSATVGNYAAKVNGASAAFNATPQVAAGVGFTAGGGVDAASTNNFVLDVAAQTVGDEVFIAHIVYDDTTTALVIDPSVRSINVNGVTRNRIHFLVRNATTGAAYALTNPNIPVGNQLSIRFMGFIF
jgi:hypothetical protein